MSNKQRPYDTSFAHSFNWGPPEHLEKALNILNCPGVQCTCLFEDHEVKSLLASNPNTPAEVLDHMSQCTQSPVVLERLAGNPNTRAHTLRRLAGHDSNDVRSAVADNTNADDQTIQTLARDANTDVRFRLAENHNVPVQVLQDLAQDDNPYVAYRAQITLSRVAATQASVEQMPSQWPATKRKSAT